MWELIDDFYRLEILILRVVHTKPICRLQFWLSHPCTGSCRGLCSWVSILEVKKNCWSWKDYRTYTEVENSCYDKICRFWHHFPHLVLGNSSVHIFIQSCSAAVSKTSNCVFKCASNSRGHMSSSPKCSLTMFCSFSQEQ